MYRPGISWAVAVVAIPVMTRHAIATARKFLIVSLELVIEVMLKL